MIGFEFCSSAQSLLQTTLYLLGSTATNKPNPKALIFKYACKYEYSTYLLVSRETSIIQDTEPTIWFTYGFAMVE